jgi:hypothetical protein
MHSTIASIFFGFGCLPSFETTKPKTNLSMKEGSLFCFVLFCSYEIHRTRMLHLVFLVSLESSRRGGVHELESMTFGVAGAKVLEYLMIFSLKNKLNRS